MAAGHHRPRSSTVSATSDKRTAASPPSARGAQPRSARSAQHFARLKQNFAALLVLGDLALHALERVVDRLRVAAEPLGHVLVGRALQVQAKRVGLERRQPRAEAEDEALELLGGDDDDGRLVRARAGQRVAEGALAVALLTGGRVAERDVLAQRRVLEAGRAI